MTNATVKPALKRIEEKLDLIEKRLSRNQQEKDL